jgi:hypothetical protein
MKKSLSPIRFKEYSQSVSRSFSQIKSNKKNKFFKENILSKPELTLRV